MLKFCSTACFIIGIGLWVSGCSKQPDQTILIQTPEISQLLPELTAAGNVDATPDHLQSDLILLFAGITDSIILSNHPDAYIIKADSAARSRWQDSTRIVISSSKRSYQWVMETDALRIIEIDNASPYFGFLSANDRIVTVNGTPYRKRLVGEAESRLLDGQIDYILLGVERGDVYSNYVVVTAKALEHADNPAMAAEDTTDAARSITGLLRQKEFQVNTIHRLGRIQKIYNSYIALRQQDQIFVILLMSVFILFFIIVILGISTLLLRARNNLKQKRFSGLEKRWQPEILNCITGDTPAESVWRLVKRKDEVFFINDLIRLIQQISGDEQDIIRRLAQPFLDRVLKKLFKGTHEEKAMAVYITAHIGIQDYLSDVIRALNSGYPALQLLAAQAICQPGNTKYAYLVVDQLERFSRWRYSLLSNMLANVGEEIVEPLIRVAEDRGRKLGARIVAIDSLTELQALGFSEKAIMLLKSEKNIELTTALLRYLYIAAVPEYAEDIIPFCSHPDYIVRTHAIKTLSVILPAEDLNVLIQATNDPSTWVAMNAAIGLISNKKTEILESLISNNHPHSLVFRQVLQEYSR